MGLQIINYTSKKRKYCMILLSGNITKANQQHDFKSITLKWSEELAGAEFLKSYRYSCWVEKNNNNKEKESEGNFGEFWTGVFVQKEINRDFETVTGFKGRNKGFKCEGGGKVNSKHYY